MFLWSSYQAHDHRGDREPWPDMVKRIESEDAAAAAKTQPLPVYQPPVAPCPECLGAGCACCLGSGTAETLDLDLAVEGAAREVNA